MVLNGTRSHRLNGHVTNPPPRKPDAARSLFSGAALEGLLKDKSITSQPPHSVVYARLPFDETDRYWWDTTGVVLSKFMLQASYPLALHYKLLAYFYDIVLPAWGPIPLETDGQSGGRPWKATMLEDGSAFEPSLNLRTTGTTETAVRFTIECSDTRSGTAHDPLNQKAAHDLVLRCAAADPDFDLTVYKYMRESLMFNDTEAGRLKEAFPDCTVPQIFLAFDFERNGRVLGKCVSFFYWKSKQLGISQREVALQFVSNLPEIGPLYKDALGAWDRFLVSFPTDLGGEPSTECVSFDMVKPGKTSRMKIYIRPSGTSFKSAKYIYTLGGLLSDNATVKGVEILRTFYQVVFDMQDGEEDKELTVCNAGRGSVLFNCSLKPNATLPTPQFYIFLKKFLPDDRSIIERLTAFWRRIGWNHQADKYAQDWQDSFPWLDSRGHGNVGGVSLAYKDDGSGVYQSVYYSPMAHIAAEKLGYR